MSNQLIKDTQATYVPGTFGTPSAPGTLGTPAYTSYEQRTVCQFGPVSSAAGTWQYQQAVDYLGHPTGVWGYVFVPAAGTSPFVVSSGTGYQCTTQTVPIYHPAVAGSPPIYGVAGTPGQFTYDFNLGWNSGARSNAFIAANDDGYAEFKVPYSLIGGVLGFNDADTDAGYAGMEHAIYLSGKTARVYESGVQVFFIGAYADGDTFRIDRTAGSVTYLQNAVLKYTSLVASSGTIFLDASLYSGGDYVYDPAIVTTSTPTVSNQSVTSCATSMLPLTGLGGAGGHLITTWPPGVYPVTSTGNVSGVVTGTNTSGTVSGSFAGQIFDPVTGVLIGDIQASASGTDPGTGFDGTFVGVVTDHTTGAVIGYVSGTLTGSGGGTTSYAATVTGTGTLVLIPAASVGSTTSSSATGTLTGTVAADGTFTGTYTGTVTNPVNGQVIGTYTATVTGTASNITYDPATGLPNGGTVTGIFTGPVIDPVTGLVIGIVIGTVSGSGTLTPNGDGTSAFVGTGTTTTTDVTFIPTAAPTTSLVFSYGSGSTSLQALTGSGGFLLPPPLYALGAGALHPLISAGISLTGEIGGGATSMLALVGGISSDHPYAEGRGVMQALTGSGSALEGNSRASMGEFVASSASIDPAVTLVAVLNADLTLAGVFAVQTVLSNVDPIVYPPGTTPDGSLPTFQAGIGASLAVTESMSALDSLALVLQGAMLESMLMDAFTPVYGSSVMTPHTVSGTITGTGDGSGTVAVTGTLTGTGITSGSATLTGTLTLTTGTVTGAVTGSVSGTVGAGGIFTGTFVGTDAAGNRITGTVTGTLSNNTLTTPVTGDGTSVWVLNWDSKASSQYENYAFNSYANFGGRYYGCKDDGVYLLEGDTDQGAPIRASASFGKLDFGSKVKKNVPNVYAGVSSSGKLFLKVTDEGTEYVYTARASNDEMRTQRFDLGKGIRASYLTFELFNNDGCDFELDSVEFSVVELTRRI